MRKGVNVIIGPPGTGKTTTVARIVREHVEATGFSGAASESHSPAVVCSLTRSAAAEVASERRGINLPKWAIGTMHSLCYRALGRPKLVEDRLGDWSRDHPTYAMETPRQSPVDASGELDDRDDARFEIAATGGSGSFPGIYARAQYDLLRAKMVPRDGLGWPVPAKKFAALWETWKRENELMDFEDLIVAGREEIDCAPGNPSLVVQDESQDASASELATLKHWGKAAGSLVLVGDDRQALYVWRGAHPEMFTSDKIDAENRSILEKSYRVPESVLTAAVKWAGLLSAGSHQEYRPRDGDAGSVRTAPNLTWKTPGQQMLDTICSSLDAGRSVMIQASCAYMLNPIIDWLRDMAMPFANPWRTKRGDWNPFGASGGGSTHARMMSLLKVSQNQRWTWADFDLWANAMLVKDTLKRGAKAVIRDKAADENTATHDVSLPEMTHILEDNAIFALLDMMDRKPAELADWWVERLPESRRRAGEYAAAVVRRHGVKAISETPRLYVGTIHSFKGSEADDVIVFPDLSNKGAIAWNARGRERDAVVRLGYVAMTRARTNLIFGGTSSPGYMPLGRFAP